MVAAIADAELQRTAHIATEIGQDEAGDDGGESPPAEPEQGGRRDHLGDRRLLLIRDLRHRRDLNEIEIPEMPDPHHPAHDVKPAKKERPPTIIEQHDVPPQWMTSISTTITPSSMNP